MQQMKTITGTTTGQCKEPLTMGCPALVDTSTTHFIHLRLREQHGKWGRNVLRAQRTRKFDAIWLSLHMTVADLPMNSQQYRCLNKTQTMTKFYCSVVLGGKVLGLLSRSCVVNKLQQYIISLQRISRIIPQNHLKHSQVIGRHPQTMI